MSNSIITAMENKNRLESQDRKEKQIKEVLDIFKGESVKDLKEVLMLVFKRADERSVIK